MDAHERLMIEDVARDYHVTAAELIRAIVFERKPISVVPCNSRHKGCTAEHRDLVDSYNDQLNREREEQLAGENAGDLERVRREIAQRAAEERLRMIVLVGSVVTSAGYSTVQLT